MKHKNQRLMVALFVLLFSINIQAAGKTNKVYEEEKYGPNCKAYSSNFSLKSLSYMGVYYEGPDVGSVHCIDAPTEREARNRCPATSLIINPANPQYLDSSTLEIANAFGAAGVKASLDVNPLGFYYCIPGSPKNQRKVEYCSIDGLKRNQSRWPMEKIMDLDFKWVKKNSTSTDGDCHCKLHGASDSAYKLCVKEEDLPLVGVCQQLGLNPDDQSQGHGRTDNSSEVFCKCSDGRYFPSLTAKNDCAVPVKVEPVSVITAPSAESAITVPTLTLKACIDNWVKKSESCKEKSSAALATCNSENTENKEALETKKIASAVGNQYINGKTASGAQQECFTASLLSNGGMTLMGNLAAKCNAQVESCNSECSEKPDDLDGPCADLVRQNNSEGQIRANEQYVGRYLGVILDNFSVGERSCKVEVKKNQSALGEIASGLGKALSASVQCMCKLSSSGANCDSIPPVADCALNPSSIGCGVYGAISVCTPGSGYDAKFCSCQLNPKEAGCPGGAASGGLSNFASPSIKSNGINDSAAPTIAGGLKAAGAFPDLLRGANDDGSSGGTPMTLGASPSSGPGGGVGGSLGGGASGGGEPPAAAGEPAAEEKGLGGLFNQAKTFFKDALGGKKTPTAAMKNGKSEKGFDPNKLRPTRGLASKNGIGSKNQDIWKMSNSCMYAETCPRNMNSFLEAPLKQK